MRASERDEAAAAARRVLVAEAEILFALDIIQSLEMKGYQGLGPVQSSEQALQLVSTEASIAGAILDTSPRIGDAFAVAAVLDARSIPFVFISSHAAPAIPQVWIAVPVFSKPCDASAIVEELASRMAALG